MAAAQQRWDHTDELLLQLCHLVDRETRTIASLFGGRKAVRQLGEPFRYRRPSDKPRVIRPRDLARRMLSTGRR